ncbi:glycosyltransferase family 1 protein [Phormidesmis priestleyi ULC007]|uniref:Glycosyltransferase family 1 protein n=1 Tax=Phormidesmis priestleyi ULC007 TaxID=1920490 RepID=A0A2T1DGX6_9CYAN|nr:glycosyltransferase family 4 protein [Phormidesmis priestleyi]PSB19694.1 glycosyltransferase family 1 protein [Phormidesmis priestleyi ULC007]PZO53578.1 MAG: glycosyltransferase family 1 protein [Phormidesmis priestleyi]
MKIAFVNQPIDYILPPIQTSVGACTYGVVNPLARSCEVMVYGRKQTVDRQTHPEIETDYVEKGVHYRFLRSPKVDHLLLKIFFKLIKHTSLLKILNRGMKPSPSVASWHYLLYSRIVAKDLAQQHCDIIHIQHSSQFLPAIRALNPKAKLVLHLHAEWFPQANLEMLAKRLQHVDLLTTVSDYITEKTRRDFPQIADRCETMYNGIHSEEFNREKNYLAARNRPIKRIMFAGRVSPEKGIHTLLEAFDRVVKHYPSVKLDIVGMQWSCSMEESFPMNDTALINHLKPLYAEDYMAQLRRKLTPATIDKVSFPGAVPRVELVDRFYNADIFVFPSIWDEGYGIPPVEAMAAGVPVVATRSGAVVETVQDGKTGFLVEKEDVQAIADAIVRLLEDDDLRETMGKAGRQRAMEFFTWERVAEKMLDRYKLLANSHRTLAS